MTNNTCIHCQSQNVTYNHEYGFYRCNDCDGVWAYSKDDPDYDECDNPDLQDALAEQMGGRAKPIFLGFRILKK